MVFISLNLNNSFTFISPIIFRIPSLRGRSYGDEVARLGGLARLGEMIFICLSSIKKFVK